MTDKQDNDIEENEKISTRSVDSGYSSTDDTTTGDGFSRRNNAGTNNNINTADSPSVDTVDSHAGSTQFSHSNSRGSNSTGDKNELARKETIHVNRLRYMVLAILTLVAVGVSVLVYFITKETDVEEMEEQYEGASSRLVRAFYAIRTERIATLASLAIAAIAHGVDHSRDWPFVSLSSYQQRAFTAKLNSGALQVSITPLVTSANRTEWEAYICSNEAEVDWIERSILYQEESGSDQFIKDYGVNFRVDTSHSIKEWSGEAAADAVPVPLDREDNQFYLPFWEMSPFLGYDEVNIDMARDERGMDGFASLNDSAIVISNMTYQPPGGIDSPYRRTSSYAQLLSIDADETAEYQGDPMTNIFIPIFDSFENDRKPMALLVGLVNWGILFRDIIPKSVRGIDLVLRNECQEPFTYRAAAEGKIIPIGEGDQHDPRYDDWEVNTLELQSGRTADGTRDGLPFSTSGCHYELSIYPSDVFMEAYKSPIPAVLVSVVAFVFAFAILLFLFYDRLVERRQTLVLRRAIQSTAIVSSLFPKNVRERLMRSAATLENDATGAIPAFRDRLRSRDKPSKRFSIRDDDSDIIADLFPDCTVLFADIAGFTAWSSARSPEQVFTLLQTIYQAFDKIALRRRVFKVETIGDSYVAVTGLPEPQPDHAVIMAKFARDCLNKLAEVTQALEVRLGPDTTDLSMRFGMNSGQVTAGVLRGDRARFQLFGDTVNTAARMESTGKRGKIQVSPTTADLLIMAGKGSWICPREEFVQAKGKGTMHTYWLTKIGSGTSTFNPVVSSEGEQSGSGGSSSSSGLIHPAESTTNDLLSSDLNGKQALLIDWMSEVLIDYVKQIVAKNNVFGVSNSPIRSATYQPKPGTICRDEVVESFDLLKVSKPLKEDMWEEYLKVELSTAVIEQIRLYVREIASRYDATNAFHNFSHACHVTMSVIKLMRRVVNDGTHTSQAGPLPPSEQERVDTYGILTSDPLTLFAIVFSALIHDVHHRGISNTQLSKESPILAERYRNKSIAEQNSFDIAWDLLMSAPFKELRKTIFPTQSDLVRFRQVAVNTVLATDIFDKEMAEMRTVRWNRVFGTHSALHIDAQTLKKTKATIVLEHIIQASDVSHTMQHWHVYIKWNRLLFEEMRSAYREGRMGADPASFWYKGELSFFDNYVIPLAKKLEECQVFGVQGSEYLNYALSNRAEWEEKGMSILEDIIELTGGAVVVVEAKEVIDEEKKVQTVLESVEVNINDLVKVASEDKQVTEQD